MKFKSWVSLITFVLLALLIYFGWGQITKAWGLLGSVNILIWLLLIPVQLLSYFTTGEMMFSYLRSKGNIQKVSRWKMTRIALELNFVNHILPSGGAAGFSYLGWVLHRYGVSAGRATIAQIIRFVLTFISFVTIVIISVLILTFDHKINKTIAMVSAALIVVTLIAIFVLINVLNNHKRLIIFSGWLTRTVNGVARFFTRNKKKIILDIVHVEKFFTEIHTDYIEIMKDKKVLLRPFLWAVSSNILDVSLIWITFYALGDVVNPAMLFIAFGVSSILSIFAATPGGAGVYETIMITFLASSGVSADVAIAGTLLARATLLAGTVIFGYVFYQMTINKYGKDESNNI